MPRNEFKFDAALPHPIRWSVGENKYDTEGDWPSQLGLQIPTESITPFCNYLMSLLDEELAVQHVRLLLVSSFFASLLKLAVRIDHV